MAVSEETPLLHPIKYWRHWVVSFGCVSAMIYGSQPVADATGHIAFMYSYVVAVAVLLGIGLYWANRRVL